jgi:hypothetical protein
LCVVQVAHATYNTVGIIRLSTCAIKKVVAARLGYRFAEGVEDSRRGHDYRLITIFGEELKQLQYQQDRHRGFGGILGCAAFLHLFERGKSGRAFQLPWPSLMSTMVHPNSENGISVRLQG